MPPRESRPHRLHEPQPQPLACALLRDTRGFAIRCSCASTRLARWWNAASRRTACTAARPLPGFMRRCVTHSVPFGWTISCCGQRDVPPPRVTYVALFGCVVRYRCPSHPIAHAIPGAVSAVPCAGRYPLPSTLPGYSLTVLEYENGVIRVDVMVESGAKDGAICSARPLSRPGNTAPTAPTGPPVTNPATPLNRVPRKLMIHRPC